MLLSIIQLPTVWLSPGVLGKKFAILARSYNAVTLNDMLLARFGSPLLVWLASVCLLVVLIGAMTVQFVGGAGLLIFGISIALYTLSTAFAPACSTMPFRDW